jgi:hypothetical protein
MLGERLQSIHVGEDGLRGDRSWAARDEERGGIEGGRKLPALASCRARFATDVPPEGALPVPEIELPGGEKFAANAPEAAEQLSALAGRTLTLWPRLPASEEAHYRRGAPDHEDLLTELRSIFGRLEDEPLPDISKLPRESMFSSTIPGTYFDCYPLVVLTRASLTTMAASQPASQFDVRRFRPNILLDSDEQDGFPENAWVGKRLRMGEAVFEIAMECPRCVFTTHAIDELPNDPKVMRALVKQNNGNLGVYASIATPGVVREGDVVELIE